jgi:hypothetical protein
MAFLYIAECSAIGGGGNHPVSGAQFPPIAEQKLDIGAGHIESVAVHNNATLLRVNCDAACSVVIGLLPVATTSSARMSAGQTEYFSIPPNSGYQVSVIANT